MPIFNLHKLVRDKLIRAYADLGQTPHFRKLRREEHLQKLVEKISEEAAEILKAPPEDRAKEIADVQQALDDLLVLYKIAPAEIRKAQAQKLAKNGGFHKGIFVETLEVPANDAWADYYRSDPERFPEVKEQGEGHGL